MPRLLLIPILLLVSTAAMAQGFTPWNPFPHKQITMWQKPDGSHDLHYNDSMRVNGNVKEHFFGLEQYTRDFRSCDSTFYYYYSRLELFSDFNSPLINFIPNVDSLISENDVIWWIVSPNRRFELRTHEVQGAQWGFTFLNGNVFDSIAMVVVSVDTASFLGYFDSVKTIRMQPFRRGLPISRYWDYKVSRSAGMVQYIPFNQIIRNQIPETWTILGFDHSNGGHYGFTSSFEDYFGGFSVGDKYKYLNQTRPSPRFGIHFGRYYVQIDSVMSLSRDALGVTLTLGTAWQSPTNQGGVILRDVVFSKQFEERYGMRRKNVVLVNDTSYYNYSFLSSTDYLEFGGDTIEILKNECSSSNSMFFFPPCISHCFECYLKNNYARGLGKIGYSTMESAACFTTVDLIGYQKNGQPPVGDMSLISGVDEVSTNSIQLFPNPANNAVYLEGVLDNSLVQVFDIHGKLMLSTTYAQGTAIPTTDLNDGVYLVRVNDGEQLNVAKLVISR